MLKRLYVNNYKCLVNFELTVQPIQLVMGGNGAGKSSVIEVLSALSDLVSDGVLAWTAFSPKTITRWQSSRTQTFEIDVELDGEIFKYLLDVEHDREATQRARISERLAVNGEPLFELVNGEVHLYRDNLTSGPKYLADWSRSALANVPEGKDNTKLTKFKRWLVGLKCLKLDPYRMTARSEEEADRLDDRLSNFVSWYRQLSQERPDRMVSLYGALKDVIDGFVSLPIASYAESARQLNVRQQQNGGDKTTDFSFDEVSDGQRALISLYALLHLGIERDSTVCLDEPDNFISLRELQPFLLSLERLGEEYGSQILLVSHNPAVIDFLAPERGIVLYRTHGGPTRMRRFKAPVDTTLSASELVARGWDDE